ncbi:transcription antitermination factor NusB [Candidatus Peribacteria bacterium RIFCSPLOWO2_12_FULL_55_15]|nr:MAG: transcription antitermination factor NusB [Candidatus Peribacteria bacterium RIFCSPHIGHO2_01_FULL_54_22]OGJ63587.1 MAG: transcription antitermination factor NusB [Candidatus Peribacteria bacterium RIFCSPHIGHO2_02_FULL_55_24]OGJ65159.1 MAG: transcription antitermination factor NusB [Candidatus Peribacteria bacterium RIFCSPHIGHO2_12_FULL_54_10]OGJ68873.1 MAG: transcription antitermination factor NusB [Candidatus Peribacteria bacterium RIFCSPLOWO2_01_FULL_54_110]OGJ69564.1 MAG: transcripti
MQVLFERERRPEVHPEVVLLRNAKELGGVDAEFASGLLQGILQHEEELHDLVQQHAPGWTWERMDPIARVVLLLGSYELAHTKDVPPAVVINEAIEVTKEYCTEESGKFVNGVLNAIAHRDAI